MGFGFVSVNFGDFGVYFHNKHKKSGHVSKALQQQNPRKVTADLAASFNIKCILS